ncbi:ARD/ARD' family domain-containing protein [Ditylenchus destructor]|nr:ARD/ARD' family domain-containing protein [Ditylenchus destructor]
MVKSWLLPDNIEDQMAENQRDPPVEVSLSELEKIGVKYFYVPVNKRESGLAEIAAARGYDYQDECQISRDKLPNYDEKVKSFFEEHLHTDEEIRYIVAGSGYFDVRNLNNQWARIFCEPGDLIILPAGIYHRFTVTHDDYIHAIRLFRGQPVWTPHNRSEQTDKMTERTEYVSNLYVS